MIITVANTKGGSGKSFLSANLAYLFAESGKDVLLLNVDKQLSSIAWSGQRDESERTPRVPALSKTGKGLSGEIQDLRKRYEVIVIDTPGADTAELRVAMLAADIVVMPVQPSQGDFWIFGIDMDPILEAVRTMKPDLPLLAVVNRAPTNEKQRDNEVRDARAYFEDHAHGVRVAQSVLVDRVSTQRSYGEGLSVVEYQPRDEKAELEMRNLFKEVSETK